MVQMRRTTDYSGERRRIIRLLTLVGAGILIAVIIWIDVATGIWQEMVILAGLAAGLISFLLSALVFNRIVAHEAERTWAPVNRLAVTEFLHAIADDEQSEIAHGIVVPRSLPDFPEGYDERALPDKLRHLREDVAQERRDLSDALSRWAEFLTKSGDNELALRHVADIAMQLDRVRDAALDLERSPDDAAHRALTREIDACNEGFTDLVAELRARLANDDERARRRDQAG